VVDSAATNLRPLSEASDDAGEAVKFKTKEYTVDGLMTKPTEVYYKMSSQVGQFEATVSQIHQENRDVMAQQRQLYKSKLQVQKEENDALLQACEHLETEIRHLKHESAGLRSRSRQLEASNDHKRAELRLIQANLSHAQEYMTLSLNKLDDTTAAQLKVLSVLDERDTNLKAKATHTQHLNDIAELSDAAPRISFLQISETEARPHEILKSLKANLADLAAKQSISEAALKETFLRDFRQGAARHASLLQEEVSLTKSRDHLLKLKSLLSSAVQHLEKVEKRLKHRLQALRGYAARLSGEHEVAAMVAVTAAAAAARNHSTADVEASAPTAKAVVPAAEPNSKVGSRSAQK
jgi:chromosome segregation ATPase